MPNYDFLNTETGDLEEHFMSYKDLDEFKKNNPHLMQQITAPNICLLYTSPSPRD